MLFVVVTQAADRSSLSYDPSLVYCASPAREDIPKPFLAHFKTREGEVYYAATTHSQSGPTLDLIRRTIAKRSIGLVILEGFRDAREPVAGKKALEDYIHHAERTCDDRFCREGEDAYAALLAARKGIPHVTGEPTQQDERTGVTKAGYSDQDLAAFYFLRWLPLYLKQDDLRREGLAALLARTQKGIPEPPLTWERFQKWYGEKSGKAFDIAAFDPEEAAPKPGSPIFTQRLSCDLNIVRNRYLVSSLARRLPEYKTILVVRGGSHFFQERRALESILGPAFIEKP